jgi:hypothetical protein
MIENMKNGKNKNQRDWKNYKPKSTESNKITKRYGKTIMKNKINIGSKNIILILLNGKQKLKTEK